jgi:hypothetical protein
MVQLSATRSSCIAILWVCLVSFAAITLCVASQRVFIVVVVYFVIGNIRIHPHMLEWTPINYPSMNMEQSPLWKANSHLASREPPSPLCNPKFHYHVHKRPSLVPFLSQMHPVNTFPPCFPSTPTSSDGSLPLREKFRTHFYLFHACHMPRPSHPWGIETWLP